MLQDKLLVVTPLLAAVAEGLLGSLPLHVILLGAGVALLLSLVGRHEACFPAVYGGLLLYGLLSGKGDPGLLGVGFIVASGIHMIIIDSEWRRRYRGFVEAGSRLGDLLPDASSLASALVLALLAYLAAGWMAVALEESRLPGLRYLGDYYSGTAGEASLILIVSYLAAVILGKVMRLYNPFKTPVFPAENQGSWASRLADRAASSSTPRGATKLLGWTLILICLLVSALNASWLLLGLIAGYASKIMLGKRVGGTMAFALGMSLTVLVLAGPNAGSRILVEIDASAKSFETLLQGVLGG